MKKILLVIIILFCCFGCGYAKSGVDNEASETLEEKVKTVKIVIPNGCDVFIGSKKFERKVEGDRSYIFVDNLNTGLIELRLSSSVFQDMNIRLNIEKDITEYDVRKDLPSNISIRPDINDKADRFIDDYTTELFNYAVKNAKYDEYKNVFSSSLSKDEAILSFNNFVEALDLNRDSIKTYSYKSVSKQDDYAFVDGNTISKSIRINWNYEPNISESLQLNTFSDVIMYLTIENGTIKLQKIEQK